MSKPVVNWNPQAAEVQNRMQALLNFFTRRKPPYKYAAIVNDYHW